MKIGALAGRHNRTIFDQTATKLSRRPHYPPLMDESSRAQNRRSNRAPVMLTAKLELGGEGRQVILRNLSTGGALVEGKWLPAEGSRVLFLRNELKIQARVAWGEGQYAGIAFDFPLDRSEVLRQVPQPKERFEPRFRRPGFTTKPLSDADRRMLRLWATPAPLHQG